MIRQSVQLIAAWLAHPVYGVNALVAQLPHDGDPVPAAVAIYNTSDHPSVARTFEPSTTPALVIFPDSTGKGAVRGHRIARDLDVGVAYVTMDDADEAVANAAADYFNRAVIWSMAHYNQQTAAKEYRKKNGVAIAAVGQIDYADVTGASGRYRLWSLLAIPLTVADTIGNMTPMPAALAG